MIDLIFTLDYELYGDGAGSLKKHVYDPAYRIAEVFHKRKAPFVSFVEVAELKAFESWGCEPRITKLVRNQIKAFYRNGIEIGLHIHPQWSNARLEEEKWQLDYSEYSLCRLPPTRINEIVEKSIDYIQDVIGDRDYKPIAFRAGNWLIQPTKAVSEVLKAHGVMIDSSVFKGGRQRTLGLDFRKAPRDQYYWRFKDTVDIPDINGLMIEVPIYTQIVPFWKLLKKKRLSIQGRRAGLARSSFRHNVLKLLDRARFLYPNKFDYCRMTRKEMRQVMDEVIRQDKAKPDAYKPIVAIGHTKDLVDVSAIDDLLRFAQDRGICISTFRQVYQRCQ